MLIADEQVGRREEETYAKTRRSIDVGFALEKFPRAVGVAGYPKRSKVQAKGFLSQRMILIIRGNFNSGTSRINLATQIVPNGLYRYYAVLIAQKLSRSQNSAYSPILVQG